MAVVNPFADDPDRAGPWEDGYEAGYAEPEVDHTPPLEAELLDVFAQGEQTGRDDRRNEPFDQDAIPDVETEDFTRFESAPDGTLIPIPSEAPEGNVIRDDAQITVNPRTNAGYYVAIYNGPEHSEETTRLVAELLQEASLAGLERLLAHAVAEAVPSLFIKFGGLAVSVVISVFTPSPILKESFFHAYLPDQTPVNYVILDPQA